MCYWESNSTVCGGMDKRLVKVTAYMFLFDKTSLYIVEIGWNVFGSTNDFIKKQYF